MQLSNKLLGQGYVKGRLRSSLRNSKFYGRYGDLINNMRYPSHECYTTFWMMTTYSDPLHWSGITQIFDPITDLDLITEFDFYLIARGFHRTFATGVACQQRTLTPPDTWSCPTLGLASVLMLRPISPELVLSPGFWVSNIPRYFCFCVCRFFTGAAGQKQFFLSYDKTTLKFCASLRFFLEVFMAKFKKIRFLNYMRRGIGLLCNRIKLNQVLYWPYDVSKLS